MKNLGILYYKKVTVNECDVSVSVSLSASLVYSQQWILPNNHTGKLILTNITQ
jgi:hypothetical protein